MAIRKSQKISSPSPDEREQAEHERGVGSTMRVNESAK
jgi:hypothetical protein